MPTARRARSLVRLVALSAAISVPAAAQTIGWTYTLRMDTDSGGGAAKRTSIVTRFQSLDDRYRTEYVQATGALGSIEGSYQIFNRADSTMTMVMPSQRMATVTAITPALAGMVDLPKAGASHITRRDVSDLGAGPRIVGHATRHFRISTAGTMEWSGSGQSCVQPLDSEDDYWIAPDLQIGAAMDDWGAALAGAPDAADSPKLPKGAALRTVSRVQRPDGHGGTRTIATTTEIVDLTRGPIAEASFGIPAGYQVMDMKKILADIPAGMMDSVMHAASEKLLTTICPGAKP